MILGFKCKHEKTYFEMSKINPYFDQKQNKFYVLQMKNFSDFIMFVSKIDRSIDTSKAIIIKERDLEFLGSNFKGGNNKIIVSRLLLY